MIASRQYQLSALLLSDGLERGRIKENRGANVFTYRACFHRMQGVIDLTDHAGELQKRAQMPDFCATYDFVAYQTQWTSYTACLHADCCNTQQSCHILYLSV